MIVSIFTKKISSNYSNSHNYKASNLTLKKSFYLQLNTYGFLVKGALATINKGVSEKNKVGIYIQLSLSYNLIRVLARYLFLTIISTRREMDDLMVIFRNLHLFL